MAVGLVLAGFALRVHALGAKSLWYDELRQIEVSALPIGQMQPLLLAHAARPLDYVILHAWLEGGQQEFWLRFPALLWSTLALALAFALARRLFGLPAALLSLALLAASAFAVQYAQEQRPYALYLLLALASFYTLERALHGRRGPAAAWLGFGLAALAGTLTHFFFVFVLAAQVLYGAGALLAMRRRAAGRGLAALAAAAALGLAGLFVAARPGELLGFVQQFAGALGAAPAAGALVSDTGQAVRVSETINRDFFVVGLLPFLGGGPGAAALLLFNGLVAAGLVVLAAHGGRRGLRRLALAGLWLFLAPLLIIVYLQYRQQFFALRYVLFALPIYRMLTAVGLLGLLKLAPGGRAVRAALGTVVLVALLVLDFNRVGVYYREPKEDWRRLGAFLTANARPGDTLGAPDVQAFIRFYAPQQPAVIVDANDVGPHKEALANGERFWFVWSKYTLRSVDETRAWVTSLPSVAVQIDPDIKVYYVHPGLTRAEMLTEAEGFVIPPAWVP